MSRTALICVGAAIVCALNGCAGTNFVRPDETVLQNNRTTIAEVRENYGAPYRESNVTKNNENVTLLSYAYASTGGAPLDAGVIPGRHLDLAFWNQKLVSNVFTSSFKEDASTFDPSKRAAIIKGKTTREDVVQLLGRPAGYAVYPMIKEKDGQALLYSYHTMRGSAFAMKFSRQELIVTVDPSGVVSDVSYESSGMQ